VLFHNRQERIFKIEFQNSLTRTFHKIIKNIFEKISQKQVKTFLKKIIRKIYGYSPVPTQIIITPFLSTGQELYENYVTPRAIIIKHHLTRPFSKEQLVVHPDMGWARLRTLRIQYNRTHRARVGPP
jgi:hypothetical protein